MNQEPSTDYVPNIHVGKREFCTSDSLGTVGCRSSVTQDDCFA